MRKVTVQEIFDGYDKRSPVWGMGPVRGEPTHEPFWEYRWPVRREEFFLYEPPDCAWFEAQADAAERQAAVTFFFWKLAHGLIFGGLLMLAFWAVEKLT